MGSFAPRSLPAPSLAPTRKGSKRRYTGASLASQMALWMARSCSWSTAWPVEYHPTTSIFGYTVLYRTFCPARYSASTMTLPVPSSGVQMSSKELQISRSRLPSWNPRRHPRTRGGSSSGGSCALKRM